MRSPIRTGCSAWERSECSHFARLSASEARGVIFHPGEGKTFEQDLAKDVLEMIRRLLGSGSMAF
ncbi:hypothetical protein MPNT_10171 [Candidatus Methylacidithermus pantelleriae]|uniref:Uncharacterized protein n=1 Tax=Candidatus Methylacidithermus pantelleriae TaxID=2744239 RepID=A0A8J2BH72_9BACT|nr:hypothetical protein MPNT_10171 [Candidatus Methylacidithermus pantelleriae]